MTVDGTVKEYPENTAEVHTHPTAAEQKIKIKKILEEAVNQWEDEGLEPSLVDFSLE